MPIRALPRHVRHKKKEQFLLRNFPSRLVAAFPSLVCELRRGVASFRFEV
jgi:hypothetical protein